MNRKGSNTFGGLKASAVLTAVLTFGLGIGACGAPLDPLPIRSETVDTPVLTGGYKSADALIQAAVRSAVRGDVEGIWAMRVTREEYERLMWPELPDREVGPIEFFWSMMTPRSRKGAQSLVSDLRGMPVRVESIEFTESPARYPSFTIHKYPVVTLLRASDGARGDLDLITGVLEWNGLFKILSIKD